MENGVGGVGAVKSVEFVREYGCGERLEGTGRLEVPGRGLEEEALSLDVVTED